MLARVEIHGYLTCPFAWRVRLAAAEKDVPAEFLPCDVDAPDPRCQQHNPDEHSPLLYHDGLTLTESGIIVTYIDEAFAAAGPALMPEDARGRALLRLLAKQLEPLDVHLERARPEARKRSEGALKRLEADLLARATPFLHGARPGLRRRDGVAVPGRPAPAPPAGRRGLSRQRRLSGSRPGAAVVSRHASALGGDVVRGCQAFFATRIAA